MSAKKEFGDFQTPLPLAKEIVTLVDGLIGVPARVVEPTAGLGSFLEAAESAWGVHAKYEGYEINASYVEKANGHLEARGIRVKEQDFFSADWKLIFNAEKSAEVLVLGNLPWVTNADLGSLGSKNLPAKTNFQGLGGFDAKTGKSNFDIAEWMLIRLIETLPTRGSLAVLCKTMTARKVLRHFWKMDQGREDASLFLIDAKTHFAVSVDACLFFLRGKATCDLTATVFSSLDTSKRKSDFGLVDGHLVSDVADYKKLRDLDGGSPYAWRSGLKHDASEVMELTPSNGNFVNGYGELVAIEERFLFPLLKSSDLGNGRCFARKKVLVTQKSTGEDTKQIRLLAPRTWGYLEAHSAKLDGRKSSIYLNRPRFSIFGIGDYSFALWKVAISGLYGNYRFLVVPPDSGKPVLLDDTCYSIACGGKEEATLIAELLNSEICQRFVKSLVFADSKRPITVDVLRRISLVAIAKRLGRLPELVRLGENPHPSPTGQPNQMQLVMEEPAKSRASRVTG